MTDDPTRILRIINKHVHDVRNSINGLDLMAGMIEDLAFDPAMVTPLAMMRADLMELQATVNSLQFKFAEPEPITVTTDDLLHLWKKQLAPLENATHQVEWSPASVPSTLTVDVNAILSVLRELVVAGWSRAGSGILKLAVRTTDTSVVAEVRDPQSRKSPEAHGLEEAKRLVEMNGGTFEVIAETVSGDQVVTLRFPLGGGNHPGPLSTIICRSAATHGTQIQRRSARVIHKASLRPTVVDVAALPQRDNTLDFFSGFRPLF